MNKRALMLALFFLALSAPTVDARSDAKCLVSFARDDGSWSPPRRVDVEFYTTRELFPDDRAYPIYAKIWFNPENPALVALDGTSLAVPTFYDSSLQKLFRDGQSRLGSELDDPQRWRIQAVVNGRWVDRRYPEAFEPPPSPSTDVQERPGVLMRSYNSGANRICIYNRSGSQYVVTVHAGASCP